MASNLFAPHFASGSLLVASLFSLVVLFSFCILKFCFQVLQRRNDRSSSRPSFGLLLVIFLQRQLCYYARLCVKSHHHQHLSSWPHHHLNMIRCSSLPHTLNARLLLHARRRLQACFVFVVLFWVLVWIHLIQAKKFMQWKQFHSVSFILFMSFSLIVVLFRFSFVCVCARAFVSRDFSVLRFIDSSSFGAADSTSNIFSSIFFFFFFMHVI